MKSSKEYGKMRNNTNIQKKNNRFVYKIYFKRLMDLLLSLIALALFSPLLIAIAILVRFKLGSPILFTQSRPGLNEEIFKLYKFRTMTNQRDINGTLLSDEKRLTSFGIFLRSTSLDELPSLVNIIKGDMSIVGPRPLLIQYLPLYNSHQKRRHEVRPGLTGLAQVNGRNAINWDQRFDLDIQYIENISFIGDWKIIFKTIKKVLVRDGISSNVSATMEVFTGNDSSDRINSEVID